MSVGSWQQQQNCCFPRGFCRGQHAPPQPPWCLKGQRSLSRVSPRGCPLSHTSEKPTPSELGWNWLTGLEGMCDIMCDIDSFPSDQAGAPEQLRGWISCVRGDSSGRRKPQQAQFPLQGVSTSLL